MCPRPCRPRRLHRHNLSRSRHNPSLHRHNPSRSRGSQQLSRAPKSRPAFAAARYLRERPRAAPRAAPRARLASHAPPPLRAGSGVRGAARAAPPPTEAIAAGAACGAAAGSPAPAALASREPATSSRRRQHSNHIPSHSESLRVTHPRPAGAGTAGSCSSPSPAPPAPPSACKPIRVNLHHPSESTFTTHPSQHKSVPHLPPAYRPPICQLASAALHSGRVAQAGSAPPAWAVFSSLLSGLVGLAGGRYKAGGRSHGCCKARTPDGAFSQGCCGGQGCAAGGRGPGPCGVLVAAAQLLRALLVGPPPAGEGRFHRGPVREQVTSPLSRHPCKLKPRYCS